MIRCAVEVRHVGNKTPRYIDIILARQSVQTLVVLLSNQEGHDTSGSLADDRRIWRGDLDEQALKVESSAVGLSACCT